MSDAEHRSAQVCASALQTAMENNWTEQLADNGVEEAIVTASQRDMVRSDPFTRHQVHVAAVIGSARPKFRWSPRRCMNPPTPI